MFRCPGVLNDLVTEILSSSGYLPYQINLIRRTGADVRQFNSVEQHTLRDGPLIFGSADGVEKELALTGKNTLAERRAEVLINRAQPNQELGHRPSEEQWRD